MAQSYMALSKLPIPILQDQPRDGQQGVGGQLGAEARVWDHQRPLGVSVLRQRGDSGDLGSLGVMDVCEYGHFCRELSCRSLRALVYT